MEQQKTFDPSRKKSVPSTMADLKEWKVGDWTILPEGGFFVKIRESGEFHHISHHFRVVSSSGEINGFTRGITLRGKRLF
jgi:hypothetical protein